jgi:hypothetical protein
VVVTSISTSGAAAISPEAVRSGRAKGASAARARTLPIVNVAMAFPRC